MADTQQQDRAQGTEQKSQDSDGSRDQAQYDSSFLGQVRGQLANQQSQQGVDWAREYFDSVESQIRAARRITEAQTLVAMRQQIVADVTSQVLQALSAQTLPAQRRQH